MGKVKAEAWVYLIVLSLIWGSSFILMKKGEEAYSAAQMASLRLCIAALCLLPVAIYNIKKIKRKQLFYCALFGLVNGGLPAFLFAEAETVVSSSTAGILNSLSPLFTFLAGVLIFRLAFNWFGFIGVLIGLAGACLLVFYGSSAAKTPEQAHASWIYGAMIVVATAFYGIASNIIKRYLQDVPGYLVSSYSYLILAIPLSIWLFFFSDFSHRFATHPEGIHSLLYIVILAVMGSAMAIIILVRLIQVSNALFGSFVTYLMPIVSIAWGMRVGESVNYITFISLCIILAGIIVAQLKKTKKEVPATALDTKESF